MQHRVPISVGLAAIATAIASLVVAAPTYAALFLVLDPVSGPPGSDVTGRTAGQGAFSSQVDPLRTFFVHHSIAESVASPDDSTLVEVGELVVDEAGNGEIHFRVPQVDPGDYVVIAYCPPCAAFSAGRAMAPLADFRVTPSSSPTDVGPGVIAVWVLIIAMVGVGLVLFIRRRSVG